MVTLVTLPPAQLFFSHVLLNSYSTAIFSEKWRGEGNYFRLHRKENRSTAATRAGFEEPFLLVRPTFRITSTGAPILAKPGLMAMRSSYG